MADHLFSEFETVSSKQWKQQLQYELKGADYNETLVWQSPEGIQVKPFYHIDEHRPSPVIKRSEPFRIGQTLFVFDVDKTIAHALDCIQRGAESLIFTVEDPKTDVQKLLVALPLPCIEVHFKLSFLDDQFIAAIEQTAKAKESQISVHLDPVGWFAREGNWFANGEKDNLVTLQHFLTAMPNVSSMSIDVGLYQNAGAHMIQQLAYAMAHVTEYYNRLTVVPNPVVFQVAVGSNYFFEIAKLRAMRLLFASVAKAFGQNTDCKILAMPSKRNKTIYDYNVNMLRTTSECMSAIVGGADTVANLPYDVLYHKSNEFGDRIARNQLLILKNESYFDKVGNTADGSYYIESLTNQLAEKALTLYKDIEAQGGLLKQLGEGTIQRKISESANAEQQRFDEGKEILLGSNKYPNKNDKMKHDLELYPFVKMKPRKTLIQPIIEKRLSESYEQERLSTEE